MSTAADRDGAPSPRIVGIVLAVVSAALGLFAAASIPNPAWGILAATLLALASVGTLAGLLLIQRKSWADKTWPPGGREMRWNGRRLRRLTTIYGAFLLAASAVAGIGLVMSGMSTDQESMRVLVLVVFFAIAGAVMIVLGVQRVPDAVRSLERPQSDPSSESGEWLRLGIDGSATSIQSWDGYQQAQVPFLFLAFVPVLLQLDPWIPAVALAGLLIVAVVAFVVWRRARRSPWVSRDGSTLRRGSRRISATDVTAASLFAVPWVPDATARSLTITFEGRGGVRIPVSLRKRGRLVLTDAASTALVAFVDGSSITLPRDKEDPTGKFSRVLYPAHLSKDQATAIVESPPGDGEPLPIGAPTAPGR